MVTRIKASHKAKPAKVVVFDNGARWAVCQHCASMYIGEIQDLPKTESATVTVTDFLSLRRLATVKGYKLRNNPLAVYKDGFLAMDFTSVENCRTWLNGHDDAYTLSDLLTESATVNFAIAHKAKALMLTLGEQHPNFDMAVQVHKDALHAYEETRRTTAYL